MKTKLLMIMLLAIFGMSQVAQAQTSVSGFISSNTNWTLAGSPYIITGNTILDSGFVLTIDPGVVVKFNTSKSLQVNGTLRAIGNSTDKITFTSNQATPAPGDWDYILFFDMSEDYNYSLLTGNIMEYCIVEYGGGASILSPFFPFNAAVRIKASYPFINYCEVRNNSSTGIRFFNDQNGFTTTDVMKIFNCTISNNNATIYTNTNEGAGGIDVYANTSLIQISNNTIKNNTGYNGGGGISCASINNINSSITNNIIVNNNTVTDGGGILINSSVGNISFNLIYGNTANNGAGVYRTPGPFNTFSNNIIASNSATYDYGGIENNGQVTFTKNTIIDNISLTKTLNADLNSGNSSYNYNTIARNKLTGVSPTINLFVSGGISPVFNNNNFVENQATYELWNDNNSISPALNVNNCWWNSISTSDINTKIYDFLDNSANAVVDYTPFLSSPDITAPVTPLINVIKTDLGSGNIQLSWTANTETDLAGYKIYYGSPTGYSFANSVNAGNVTTYTLSGVSVTDTIAVTAYDNLMNGTNDQLDGNESWFTNSIGKPIVNFSATPINVCAGDTVYFADNTIDAASWTWNFPGGMPAVSSSKNPKVIYNASGTYSVKLKVTNIAGTDSLTLTNYIGVDSLPNPVITAGGATTFCQGNSVTLDAGAGYTSYLWSGSETTQSIVVSTAGTYSVNVSNNCGNTTAAISVTVNSLPTVSLVLNLDTACQGNGVIVLSGGLPAAGMYSGTGVTSGNFDPSIAGSGTHTITYVYFDGNNCSDSATATIYVDLCTGIQTSVLNESVTFFPNPSTGKFTIDSQITNGEITIYNMQGEKIYQSEIKNEKPEIDLSNQPNGIYLCRISVKNQTILKKIIIDK